MVSATDPLRDHMTQAAQGIGDDDLDVRTLPSGSLRPNMFGPLTSKYWDELAAHAKNPLIADIMRQLVTAHYNERLGGYHDLSHLEELFGHLDRMFNDPDRFPEFDPRVDATLLEKTAYEGDRQKLIKAGEKRAENRLVAIASTFWHDIVYDIVQDPAMTRVTNEERSARMSKQHLYDLGIHDDMRATIASWVNSTNSHRCNPKANMAQAYFLDADMAIMGASPDRYTRYRKQVREDYARYSDEAYRAGRYNFLLKMLKLADKNELFLTPQFQEDFGAQAKANIEAEMADIETVYKAENSAFRRPHLY
ncbi:MAG: hypothetical protein AB7E85_05325 [Pseudobdellovibrionaceae bacterium]